MKNENDNNNYGYFISNPTMREEERSVRVVMPPIARNEDICLGIDEKNYTPLRASRRLVGYVKKQD